jgi:AcrR family transcriptional regulator
MSQRLGDSQPTAGPVGELMGFFLPPAAASADRVYAVHRGERIGVRRTLVNRRFGSERHSQGKVVRLAQQLEAPRRVPLSRDRVLRAAVALADTAGIESLSMRKLAQELGVVPMALYKHVADKDELLDGMVDIVVGEIDPPLSGTHWRSAVRQRILSARWALLRHPWASRVIESRTNPTPVVLEYMDSMIGMFRAGGFSVDLTHHVMHAVGSRIFGFTQELSHDEASVVGPGCDDQFEFEFALDLLLDGIDRLRQQERTSTGGRS